MFRILLTAAIVWGTTLGLAQAAPSQQIKVVRLKHADPEDTLRVIVKACESLRQDKTDDNPWANVRLAIEPRTGSIIIAGKPEVVSALEPILRVLDAPPRDKVGTKAAPLPMVQVELLVIETAKPAKKENGDQKQQTASLTAEQLKKQLNLAAPGSTVAAGDVAARIDSLEARGRLRVARHVVVSALNGNKGRVTIGEKKPVVTGTSFSQFGQQNNITFREVGLTCEAFPRVAPNGVIAVRIEYSETRLGSPDEGVVVSRNSGNLRHRSRTSSRKSQTSVKSKPKSPPTPEPKPAPKPKEKTVRIPGIISILADSTVQVPDGHVTVIGGLTSNGMQETDRLILVSARIVED